MYKLINRYGIPGSTHKTVRAALRERDKREGTGWTVEDDAGNGYDGSKSDNYERIERVY
jgi:hypothetical protein